jgi:hypothetical protein
MYRESQQILSDLLARDAVARARNGSAIRSWPIRDTPVAASTNTSLDNRRSSTCCAARWPVGPRPITVGEFTRYGRARWHPF